MTTRASVSIPGFRQSRSAVDAVGAITTLAGRTMVSAVRRPRSYGAEFVDQFMFTLRLCWFPMMVASIAFTYGPAGVQAANFLNLFGAIDRLGGVFVLVVIREFAPLICAIVVAGVAGTAITADLGARKIREEIDALQVLGVDTVKHLVVPRFLALMLATAMFDIYALIFGTFGGIVVTVTNDAPIAPFFATYFTNATTVELLASLVKATCFGVIIAMVCCYKGLTVSGGPEGVGRAVNQAVVISFLGIGALNVVFTQTLLATNPELSAVR